MAPLQFETMIQSNHIREFRCFYEVAARRFHSVVQLGKDVCGFPQVGAALPFGWLFLWFGCVLRREPLGPFSWARRWARV